MPPRHELGNFHPCMLSSKPPDTCSCPPVTSRPRLLLSISSDLPRPDSRNFQLWRGSTRKAVMQSYQSHQLGTRHVPRRLPRQPSPPRTASRNLSTATCMPPAVARYTSDLDPMCPAITRFLPLGEINSSLSTHYRMLSIPIRQLAYPAFPQLPMSALALST